MNMNTNIFGLTKMANTNTIFGLIIKSEYENI
jgi:hypothetical protein